MTEATHILRTLRGAPLSCLIALALHHHQPVGVMQLMTDTGYCKSIVKQGLLALEQLGFAASTARFNAWQLTDQGFQLPLFSTRLTESEGKTFTLASSSSSSLNDRLCEPESIKLLPQQQVEGEKITLDPLYLDLIDFLLAETGATRKQAERAIAAASERQNYPAYIRYQVLRWLAYMQDYGKGINSPGAFICRKIERDEPCPEWPNRTSPNMLTPYQDELRRRLYSTRQEWEAEERANVDDVPSPPTVMGAPIVTDNGARSLLSREPGETP